MQRGDRYPENYEPDTRSRPGSRRNSASLSRKGSICKEREGQKTSPTENVSRRSSLTDGSRRNSVAESGRTKSGKEKPIETPHSRRNSISKERDSKKKSPLNSTPSSSHSTPKKNVKQLDLFVAGKQLLKRSDRANSLPGTYHRRPSTESVKKKTDVKRPPIANTSQSSKSRETSLEDDMSLDLSQQSLTVKKKTDVKRPPIANTSQSSKSRETSLEDDMSLDLSQVSDFEDTSSKYGVEKKSSPLATSTPKSAPKNFQKSRSASLHSQMFQKVEASKRKREDVKKERSNSTFTCSRESFVLSSANSSYRYAPSTELDYSSVSPEYSGQSSADMSPRRSALTRDDISPRSQDLVSSCCVSTWQDCSKSTAIADRADGEWNTFWANYNNSLTKVPMKNYYDQCPTPYRTENIDLADLDFSETSKKRSPEDVKNINYIIRNEGLHLTPRETQNIIKCAHILGNVLTKAIDRRSKEKHEEFTEKVQEIDRENTTKVDDLKKNLTLNLRETVSPLKVNDESQINATTQTDISLPNTKSAPKIFEKILRQLSKTSLEDTLEKKLELKVEKDDNKKE